MSLEAVAAATEGPVSLRPALPTQVIKRDGQRAPF